jgi:hypothetical protein
MAAFQLAVANNLLGELRKFVALPLFSAMTARSSSLPIFQLPIAFTNGHWKKPSVS